MFKSIEPQPAFAAQEEEILAFWQADHIFEKSVAKNQATGSRYTIYDGPPYLNAKPPLHTIVPMSFKDLVGRYRTMRGDYVPRQNGWDTHGLPIEVQVEKALGLTSKRDILNLVPGDEKASIRKFNQICRESVMQFRPDWDQFVSRVGYWTDIEHPYVTYEPSYIDGAWQTFKRLWDKDLVFKGYKVLPYCPRCGTGLSAAEVAQEYHDVKDTSVFVAFPLVDNPKRAFLAWTTTPWTLPGNVALAVGSSIEYVVVKQAEQEYVLAKSRLESLQGEYEIVETMLGADLVGLMYTPPFPGIYDQVEGKKYSVVAADFVTTEDGTGVVHTAVMYGEDDFNLGKQENLAMMHTVGPDGAFLDAVPQFAGQNVREALGPILTYLTERGVLYAKKSITHSYPFCWRCKTALIYYATDSWYIAMSRLRKDLVEANNQVQWVPEHLRTGRFGEFIKEARDWAVSRARFWGIPLPVWTSANGDCICIGSFDELRQYAVDHSLIGPEFDPHRPDVDDIVLEKDGVKYFREPFVLDIWFDSGAMPYALHKKEEHAFPADFVAEAIDQTRGWFYTMHALGTALYNQAAYKRVVCMGHMVDDQGKKMSKSGPNSLVPWEVFDQVGVDSIRWFLYTVNSPGEPKAFSIKEVQASQRRYQILIWNILNFFVTYANLQGFEPAALGARADLTDLDRWILGRQAAVINDVTVKLDDYDFMRAGRSLEQYVNDLSTWYLRRSRKRTDTAFLQTLYEVLCNLASLTAPLTPFLAEAMFQVLRQSDMPESIHLTEWLTTAESEDTGLAKQMAIVRQAVELGLAVRAGENLKVRQPLAAAYLDTDSKLSAGLLEILADELNVEKVIEEAPSSGMPSRQIEGLQVGLDTVMTDALVQAGFARDLLRQIQQLRKEAGLAPGTLVTLVIEPSQRFVVESLLQNSAIQQESYLQGIEYGAVEGESVISLNGQSVPVELRS